MRSINGHLRASRKLVLMARYEVLSRFDHLPWRQRAKAVRMLVQLLNQLPEKMEAAADRGVPYSLS